MSTRSHPKLVLIGGFLGAGKTSLLLRAATLLRDRGLRVGVITNDQGGELVDTRFVSASGFDAEEVGGACFCCHFSDFIRAADRLLALNLDVIFAEPVGSCMDISATILQPVKMYHRDLFQLAPFTVLVDPQRAIDLLHPGADPHLAYLFRNQLAEADLVCYSKVDIHSEFPALPGGAAFYLSAQTGQGVAEWLSAVLAGSLTAGARLLEVDYAQYAEAEAALGWLNWQATLQLKRALTPSAVVGPLLDQLDESLTRERVQIAHLKIFDQTTTGYIKAGICQNGSEPSVDGDLIASPARRHELVLNLRACAPPELLENLVERVTAELPGSLTVVHRQCFRPRPPVPEQRLDRIV